MINNKLKSPNRSIRLLWGFASRSHWHSGFFFGLFSLHYRPSWSMNQFQSSNWVSKSESFIRCVDAGSRCVDAPFEATERLQTAAKWAVAIQRWKKNNNKMSPFLDCDWAAVDNWPSMRIARTADVTGDVTDAPSAPPRRAFLLFWRSRPLRRDFSPLNGHHFHFASQPDTITIF